MSEYDEMLGCDILFVGAGPATLACVTRLIELVKDHNEKCKKIGSGEVIDLEDRICVLEKGVAVGAHTLSGALIEKAELRRIVDRPVEELPFIDGEISEEKVCFLTPRKHFQLPVVPPAMKNRGNYVVSVSRLCKYFGEYLESNGVPILCGETADELIMKNACVSGVLSYPKNGSSLDCGNGKSATRINSRVTVFGEGSLGFCTEKLIERQRLFGPIPRTFELGIKELHVRRRAEPDTFKDSCLHTMGYPLHQSGDTGGGFIYATRKYVVVGLVAHLNTRNPDFNLHRHLRKFKEHPVVEEQLRGTEMVEYGSKILPCGGASANPQLVTDGAIIIGDAAGLVDTMRLKGLGNAITSGIIAANTLYQAMAKNDYSIDTLKAYKRDLMKNPMYKKFSSADGFSQAISAEMPFPAVPLIGLQSIFGGELIHRIVKTIPDYKRTKKKNGKVNNAYIFDGVSIDRSRAEKEKSVYFANTAHVKNSESHISIKDAVRCTQCINAYGAPCASFCPAGVYEAVNGKVAVSAENCLHCRTCSLKCPYENVLWRLPAGGAGPKYSNM
ncbi:MAG: hypothetical protein GF344_18985 [Chitinivibrionales bacterium]|nr:hypothetical protein [Chitinivibrionales bacterium]